jgi:branched-chain amino acid transport system substrate-binding protein
LITCAIGALLATALGGCATRGAATSTVSGQTLTIYASAATGSAGAGAGADVLAAEQLAFAQSGRRAGGHKLNLVVLHGAKASDNARTAIQNTTTIAYVGEIVPGTSADSMGIVGDQQILSVSPTDTAVELTQSTPAVPGAPGIYYETTGTGSHTFARVVPTTAQEAKALVAAAADLHVTKLFVAEDGLAYGAALANAVKNNSSSGVALAHGPPTAAAFASSGADAALFASADRAAATRFFDAVAASRPSVKLMAPSALSDDQFAGGLSPAAQQALQVSSPGFLPTKLPATARKFTAAFAAAYGHPPAPEAIFGYEAMSALISVLRSAGSGAANRTTVRDDFFAIRNRSSVLGKYSINANGDTNIAPFVISKVKSGRLTPYRFVSEQG